MRERSISVRLEYWRDGTWYVGRQGGVPGVFSQGRSLSELEENIRDVYQMIVGEKNLPDGDAVEIEAEV